MSATEQTSSTSSSSSSTGELNGIESYNKRSPAVKRILREASEMREAGPDYFAQPLEDNIFEWHFTVRGAPETDFENGIYHGRIVLPNDYPMKPPSIILLTPNGRFEVNKKICLSISGHHPETWQPCWSIRTVLLAIIAFMPTKAEGGIGALDYTPAERRRLARRSLADQCPTCGPIRDLLPAPGAATGSTLSNSNSSSTATGGATNLIVNRKEDDDKKERQQAEFRDFMQKVSFTGERSLDENENSTGNSSTKVAFVTKNNDDVRVSTSDAAAEEAEIESTSQQLRVESDQSSTDAAIDTATATVRNDNNNVRGNSRRDIVPASNNFLQGSITDGLLMAIFILIVAIIVRRFAISTFWT